MRKIKLLTLLVLISLGCSGSTNTGNPTLIFSAAQNVLSGICFKLTECFSTLDEGECTQGIENNTTIDTEIGLNGNQSNQFLTYLDIIHAEVTQILVGNADKSFQCVDDISVLDCASNEVINSYDPSDPNNFDNVVNLLSTSAQSCKGVF